MAHTLHINDNNLLVQNTLEGGGDILLRSQGYALLSDNAVAFDINSEIPPISQSRLSPQQINSRYWQQCAQTAIAENQAGMRHAADLVWKHLSELKNKLALDKLAMVVPAHYKDSHLKLLLGVAKASGLEATALISKPVLAVQQANLPLGPVWHIDVQMHQTVVSKVVVSDTEILLQDIEIKSGIGLYSLQEDLLHTLQASFIGADRFDPLHDAQTEQQLFDQLSNIVQRASRGEKVGVSLGFSTKLYSATFDNADVCKSFVTLSNLIKSFSGNQIIIDMNAEFDLQALSGPQGPLADQSSIIWANPPKPISDQAAEYKSEAGEVIYQTSLPVANQKRSVEQSGNNVVEQRSKITVANEEQQNIATHLMQMGLIVPIEHAKISASQARLTLQFDKQASDLAEMLEAGDLQIVNDQARTFELRANDRLMSPIADGVITALTLLNG